MMTLGKIQHCLLPYKQIAYNESVTITKINVYLCIEAGTKTGVKMEATTLVYMKMGGYNYAILLHQLLTLVNSHMPETYLSTSPGQVCQSVSCQVIEFDVTVVQWYCQCMSVIMGHRQPGKMSNSIIVCGPAMTSCGV